MTQDEKISLSYVSGYLHGLSRLLERDALSAEARFRNSKKLKGFADELMGLVQKDEEIKLTKEEEDLLFYAFRYSLGRRTYISGQIVGILITKWQKISAQTKHFIQTEIEAAMKTGRAGDDTDVKEWKKILKLKL